MVSGRRSLLAVLQRTSVREVAARCGVDHSSVVRWLSGRMTTPSDVARERLESIYGISAASWGRPAVRLSAVKHAR